MASPDLPIILFHYPFSPYARRVVWYLTLRGISYTSCFQPPILPRPDLTALGISYRRIPLLSIGRDVYADTRIILQKLEELYPPSAAHPSLSASSEDARAVERLLSHFIIDGGVFPRAAQLLPLDLPIMNDPKFMADRADLVGAPKGVLPFSKGSLAGKRPEAIAEIRDAVELLETTLLADGREWVLKTQEGPTLADIEAVWVFHWLTTMPGALPDAVVGPKQFPKVWAWIERFQKAVDARQNEVGKAKSVKGDEAARLIVGSGFAEEERGGVDQSDVVVAAEGLRRGDLVRMWPTDSGAGHKDKGTLVAVTTKQIVIETQGAAGSVRLHAPRHGFRVQKDTGKSTKL